MFTSVEVIVAQADIFGYRCNVVHYLVHFDYFRGILLLIKPRENQFCKIYLALAADTSLYSHYCSTYIFVLSRTLPNFGYLHRNCGSQQNGEKSDKGNVDDR